MDYSMYDFQQQQLLAQERMKMFRTCEKHSAGEECIFDLTLGLDAESRSILAKELGSSFGSVYYAVATDKGWNWRVCEKPIPAPAYKVIMK